MYGVALIPNKQIVRELVSFRKEFSECFSGPQWEIKGNMPHVTLFKTELKDDAKPSFLLQNIYDLAEFDVPASTFAGLTLENRNWVFANVQKNEVMESFHDSAKVALKSSIAKDKIKVKKFMGDKVIDVENYLKYGYRYVGESFSSQFILGRHESNDSELYFPMVEAYEERFLGREVLFSRIVMYKTGRYNFMGPVVASKKLQTFKERLFIS